MAIASSHCSSGARTRAATWRSSRRKAREKINPGAIDPPDLSHHFFSVYEDLTTANSLVVGERNVDGDLEEGPFSIVMFCD
jgi:hypothetical protein